MKAKEKAVELVEDFADAIYYRVEMFNPNLLAKECALIAVDEILEATKTYKQGVAQGRNVYNSYWKEVKIEIEKL